MKASPSYIEGMLTTKFSHFFKIYCMNSAAYAKHTSKSIASLLSKKDFSNFFRNKNLKSLASSHLTKKLLHCLNKIILQPSVTCMHLNIHA